jgi:hypothetical protein
MQASMAQVLKGLVALQRDTCGCGIRNNRYVAFIIHKATLSCKNLKKI